MKIPANINKALRVGSQGPNVRILEKKLKQRGLLQGPIDGKYDAQTKAAVQRAERKLGYKTDGVVGNRIWDRITGNKPSNLPAITPLNAPNTGSKGEVNFKTASINVKSNPLMPQSKVVHDVKLAASQADLIGWQEIAPARYRQAIKDLGPKWGHYMPRDGKIAIPTPISWDKEKWKKVDAGFTRTHNGKARVSPHRYITWVKLKDKETGQEVVRINTHLVSGAWSKPKPTTAWRRAMWTIHMNKLENLVERFQKKGLNVVVGGDFNRDGYKVLGNKVKYDNNLNVGTHGGPGSSTLDIVMHSSKNKVLEKEGGRIARGYASDHDAVIVKYSLDKK